MPFDVEIEVTIEDAVKQLEHPTDNGFVVVGFGTCRCFQQSRHITISMPCPCIIVEMKNGAEFRKKIPPFQAAILAAGVLNEEDAKKLKIHKTSPFVFAIDNGKVRFLGGNQALQKWVKDNPGAPKPLHQEDIPENPVVPEKPVESMYPSFPQDQNILVIVHIISPKEEIKLNVRPSITGKELKTKINSKVAPREVSKLIFKGKYLEDGMQLQLWEPYLELENPGYIELYAVVTTLRI